MLQSRAARNAACARTYFDPSIRLPGRLDLVPRFRLISGLERTPSYPEFGIRRFPAVGRAAARPPSGRGLVTGSRS